ncbi:F-box domain [Arabidopsis thaliana x Arabidopsis arenosa]|uniref:F-box domain n=1 Tax=Arabidopsis thaliana x Arabidopsis arenosa TaxID=1240361 RepID=A0A8T1ZNK6_9BRAS|nr:F-box domain [Arabidopsis thaliana x Arabidopsis arenosa]
MTTISDLPDDLVREIFSRVPLTSLSAVRSTCKTWNAISKNQIFGKKSASKNQFLEFMITDSRVCSLRFDLQGIRNEDEEDFVHPFMKQISIPNNDDQVEISQVYHCDGLLLCIAKNNSSLMVWNPYLGQTKWIRPRNTFHRADSFALGYDNNRNHKILRFLYDAERNRTGRGWVIDVYDFSSDSWRVLDVNPDWDELFYQSGVSLKGNSYFFGREVTTEAEVGEEDLLVTDIEDYLLCFDFTTERFGPRLSLPFNPPSPIFEYLTLSWARDEKLAVLYSHYDTSEIYEIWISTKIEPNAVSWSTFLTVDMSLIIGLPDGFSTFCNPRSFFIDEEKKVAVFFCIEGTETGCYLMAYIVGDEGYFKSVNIGVILNSQLIAGKLVCSSYDPSLVQLQV